MSGDGPEPARSGTQAPVEILAPAKLTLSLRVVGVRPDGYHLLESEMVSVDLADTLVLAEGDGLTVTAASDGWTGADGRRAGEQRAGEQQAEDNGQPDGEPVPLGPGNLVSRALGAVGRKARVDLVKRIPPGAGLGGGSADAAAVLRWAGCHDLEVALALGADVPFCLTGGRAMVRGIGEDVDPLPYEARAYTLLLLPFGLDTAAVYRAWDRMERVGRRRPAGPEAATSSSPPPCIPIPAWPNGSGRSPQPAGECHGWREAGLPGSSKGPRTSSASPIVSCRWTASGARWSRSGRFRRTDLSGLRGPLGAVGYLPAARRCQRVAFSIFLCFFLRIRLRRFLIREPMSTGDPSRPGNSAPSAPAGRRRRVRTRRRHRPAPVRPAG